jgi:hypothetical protein
MLLGFTDPGWQLDLIFREIKLEMAPLHAP